MEVMRVVLKLNELTTLVTKLSERIGVLEDDLKKTKLTYSAAVTKLILRVKKLKTKLKAGTARKRSRVVLSEDKKGNSKVSTAGATKGTASEVPVVSTAGRTVTYKRRSEEKKDKKRQGKSNNDRIARDEEIARQWDEEEGQRKQSRYRLRFSRFFYLTLLGIPREDVVEDVESLSTNYPIVDWKTCVLTENFMYYQIFKGDGSSKNLGSSEDKKI
ncbi:hypothetical protein Tco_1428509 [Tanacetum coccineum]